MASIFEFNSYIEFLNQLVKQRESLGKTRSQLASAIGCQAAYFSQVLKAKVDLTEDHLAKLSEYISLSNLETEYLLILLRLQKAGTSTLKEHLKRQADQLIQENKKIGSHIRSKKIINDDAMKSYYSSHWQASVIHVATASENLRSVKAISKRFHMPESVVEYHLSQLEKYKLVQFQNGEWQFCSGSIHFPNGSPLDNQFQLSRRLMALNAMAAPNSEDIHYSVVFCSTPKMYKILRNRFCKIIEEIHRDIEPTASEEVYSIAIDLFRT